MFKRIVIVSTVKFYLADLAQAAWQAAQNPRLDLQIDAVDENGELLIPIAAGEWTVCNTVGGAFVCNAGPQPVAGTYTMEIPAVTIPADARISILVSETGAVASASRTVYGGSGLTGHYSDAGVKLTTGTIR